MSDKIPFPFREISKHKRDKSFEQLCNYDEKELKLSWKYNLCSDYYFQEYRLETKKGKWSNVEVWNDPNERKKVFAVLKKHGIEETPDSIRRIIKLWYGCVNQFRPDVAVYIYRKYKPRCILDFSAGWGDRAIAAMSQGIDYIGIDSNKSLKVPYNKMIKDLSKIKNSNITMIFDYSENVDFSKFKYDLVFTSPPYFSIEKYKDMKDYSKESFIDDFFKIVIKNVWKHLQKGGTMALNMPKEMEEIVETVIVYKKKESIKMPIQNRNYTSNVKNHEYIYCWTK